MSEKCHLKLLIFLFILLGFSCKKATENNYINFCLLLDTPERYQSKIIETKAIIFGYHTFIFYSDKCLEQKKIIALEMSYESRQKIGEFRNANRMIYKKGFLNNNLYSEIVVTGKLRKNDDDKQPGIYYPEYKFFVDEIKEINILRKEIYPTEKARGLEKINIK